MPFAFSLVATRYIVHGARMALWRMRLAMSSPMNSPLIGSHFCVRPVQVAMFPRCPTFVDRVAVSTFDTGCERSRIA